jgi:hypothetical protein
MLARAVSMFCGLLRKYAMRFQPGRNEMAVASGTTGIPVIASVAAALMLT